MTDQTKPRAPLLPHHKLVAYGAAVELLLAVKAANIRDAKLRDEAVRAAKGTCLNCAEGAGRVSRADKARVFAIARGEAVEAVAAVEIAAHAGSSPIPWRPSTRRLRYGRSCAIPATPSIGPSARPISTRTCGSARSSTGRRVSELADTLRGLHESFEALDQSDLLPLFEQLRARR